MSVDCIQVGNRTYDLGDVLGVGGFSEVRKGVDRDTRKRVALKIMYQDGTGPELKNQLYQVQQEIKAMKKLNHPNLIRLLGYDLKCKVGDRKSIVMVQQLAPKGELFDYLMYTKKFEQNQAVAVFKQLIAGLEAMHDRGIAHRDLKPENLLFDNQYNLKIADFGFSKVYQKKEGHKTAMATELGTKGYMAPEILGGKKYTEKADIFASGVILFIMLAGFPPFQNADSKDWWFDKITKKKYKLFWMAHERTAKFSNEAKGILQKMLAAKEVDRLDVKTVQQTEFWNLPCPTKEELAKILKQRKVIVDQQKQAEQAGTTRDTLLEIVIPDGEVTPNSTPVLLRDILKNDMSDQLKAVDSKQDLQSLLFKNIDEQPIINDLRDVINKTADISSVVESLSSCVAKTVTVDELREKTGWTNLHEKAAKKILSRLNTTTLGDIDDWVVAEKFAPLDNVTLPYYAPLVYKTHTYKTKIGFGMLGYTVSSFVKNIGTLKVISSPPCLEVNLAIKKKVILPVEDAEGNVKFNQGKINAIVKMKISLLHDEKTAYNVVVFENISDSAFTMAEFASCVKELTTNRKYYLAYFLEDAAFEPTKEHLGETEIPDDFVMESVDAEEEVGTEA